MLPGIYDQGPESIGSRDVSLAVLPVRRKMKQRGLFVSADDEQYLAQIEQKIRG